MQIRFAMSAGAGVLSCSLHSCNHRSEGFQHAKLLRLVSVTPWCVSAREATPAS